MNDGMSVSVSACDAPSGSAFLQKTWGRSMQYKTLHQQRCTLSTSFGPEMTNPAYLGGVECDAGERHRCDAQPVLIGVRAGRVRWGLPSQHHVCWVTCRKAQQIEETASK